MKINLKTYNVSDFFNKNKNRVKESEKRMHNNNKNDFSNKSKKDNNINNQKSNFILYNKNSSNIKFSKRNYLSNNSLSNELNSKDNNKTKIFKKMKKSNSINGYFTLRNNYNHKRKEIPISINYEYNQYLVYKKKKRNEKEDLKLNEMKEKYFIRGLAINKELAVYYLRCKRVDYSENKDLKEKTNISHGHKKSIDNNKLFSINNNNHNNKEINKMHFLKNNKKRFTFYYSLKNLLNNQLPLTIK